MKVLIEARLFWVRRLVARARRCSRRAAKLVARSNECLGMAERHQMVIRDKLERAANSHPHPEDPSA